MVNLSLTLYRGHYALVYVRMVWLGTLKTFLRSRFRYIEFIEPAICLVLCSGTYVLVLRLSYSYVKMVWGGTVKTFLKLRFRFVFESSLVLKIASYSDCGLILFLKPLAG